MLALCDALAAAAYRQGHDDACDRCAAAIRALLTDDKLA